VDGESGGWLFWEEAEAGGGRRILADPLQLYKSSRHLFHVQHLRVATVQTHSLYNFFIILFLRPQSYECLRVPADITVATP